MKQVVAISIILILGIAGAYYMSIRAEKYKPLPIISPADVNPQLVDESLQNKRGKHIIAPFSLTNQLGETVTNSTVDGKIYVANFFFTTCPTICPAMNSQVKRVYEYFKENDEILFLSHTVMPEVDSVSVMLAYANRLGVKHYKWQFLTGSKEELYRLARQSYLAAPVIGDLNFAAHGEATDFVHTENLVLVDKRGRIRGIYDGLNQVRVDELIADIEKLLMLED